MTAKKQSTADDRGEIEWLKQAIAEVQIAESKLAALRYAINDTGGNGGSFTRAAQDEYGALHIMLYNRLHNAYRQLMMAAGIYGKRSVMQQAARIAGKRFHDEIAEIDKLGRGPNGTLEWNNGHPSVRLGVPLECARDHGDGPCNCVDALAVLNALNDLENNMKSN